MEKIVKFAKTLDVILRVCWWIFAVSAACMAIGFIVCSIIPNDYLQMGFDKGSGFAIEYFNLTMFMKEPISLAFTPKTMLLAIFGSILLMLPLSFLCIHQLRAIMRHLKEGDPFAPQMSSNIKKLSYLMFLCAVVPQSVSAMMYNLGAKFIKLDELLTTAIPGMKMDFDFIDADIIVIFAALIVLLLAKVFEYGTLLQQEQNTTL